MPRSIGAYDLGIVELHQHVGARCRAGRREGHERRHVEGTDADDVEIGMIGGEPQLPRVRIGEGSLGSMPARANTGLLP